MPSTYTQALRLEKMANGENNLTWGDKANNTLDLIDAAMAGVTTVDVSGRNVVTLSVGTGVADDARAPVLVLVGTMSNNTRIVYPPTRKWLIVFNSAVSSGATPWNVYISHSTTGGFGVPVNSGSVLYGDGVNFTCAGGSSMILNGVQTTNAVVAGTTLQVGQSATIGVTTSAASVGSAGFLGKNGAGTGASGPVVYSVNAAGPVIAPTFFATSDARAKSDLSPISGDAGRTWVLTAKPMRYLLGDDPAHRAGFIAQDMVRAGYGEMVMPMLDDGMQATTDADGLASPEGVRLNLDYLQTIAYLTAHAQQLEARLSALEAARAA